MLKNVFGRTDIGDSHKRIRHGYSPAALVNAATHMQPSQVAQTAQALVLKKAMDIQSTSALAILQTLPLATSGNLGTQVNTMV